MCVNIIITGTDAPQADVPALLDESPVLKVIQQRLAPATSEDDVVLEVC